MEASEFFGTLQQSIVDVWRAHLQDDKYSSHVALNDYYEDTIDLIDELIENYMGIYGKVEYFKSIIDYAEYDDVIEYLRDLRKMIRDNKNDLFGNKSELLSNIDDILSKIDTTIYKLTELTEDDCCNNDKKEYKIKNKTRNKKHIRDYIKNEEE